MITLTNTEEVARDFVRARMLMQDAFCCDLHGCMPTRHTDETVLPQLERYRQAGIKLVFVNVGWDILSIEEHVRILAHYRSWIHRNADNYTLVTNAASIAAATAERKLAIAFDIEGMNAISDQPALLELYYELGVRWMAIAYNKNNLVGGGCQDEDSGLTRYGRSVIQRLADVGMMLCCSHTGKRTALQAIDISPNPIIFSHSNAAAVHPHPRNVDDETIIACARRGGVIGVNGIGRFLGAERGLITAYVRHVDHMVQLVGPEHVALGLDYVFDPAEADAYIARFPEIYPPELYRSERKMVRPEQVPEVIDALLRNGYSESALKCILGENLLRIAKEVWR